MLEWTSWPFDPADVGKENFEQALQALRDEAADGVHQVDRATGALEIATSLAVSRAGHLDRHPETLARIDRAVRDVRRRLEDAMDLVYEAVRTVDELK